MSETEKMAPKDAAQEALKTCGVQVGMIYERFDGRRCQVVALAIDDTTAEPIVVYQSRDGLAWSHPLATWSEEVQTGPDPKSVTPRFMWTGDSA